jgi:hypothetical protein
MRSLLLIDVQSGREKDIIYPRACSGDKPGE